MKTQLYAIAILLTCSTPLFSQVSNSTPQKSSAADDKEADRVVTESNSLILRKGDDGGFAAGITLSITPNPTYGNTVLILTTELPVQVQIRLLDAGGDLVAIVTTLQLPSGINYIPANFNSLTSGIYYIQAITAGSGAIKKMVVM